MRIVRSVLLLLLAPLVLGCAVNDDIVAITSAGAAGSQSPQPGAPAPASADVSAAPLETGVADAGVSALDASMMTGVAFKPAANLDPNAKFDWQETPPGAPANAACQAGVYRGTFECLFVPDAAMFGADAATMNTSGSISLALVPAQNGEFLEITEGELDAVAQVFFAVHAMFHGRLDCKSLKLMGTATDGTWTFGDPSMPIVPGVGGTFGADLQGTLDPLTGALAGDWALTSGTIPGTCTGRWSTTHVP